jgi:hypothetical protein
VVAVDGLSSFGRADAPLTEASDSGEPPERIKDALVRVLGNDPDWQVRAAAVDAIRHLRFKEGVQPLIDRMRVEEGRIRQDAYEALRELTFLQYGDDPAEWQGFWDRAGAQFKLPDLDVVMAARKKRQAEGGKYTPAAPGFAGIETKSRRILFVIDVSRSMEEEVIDTERFREGDKDYPSLQRLEIVKQELIRTVEGFDENVYFNILAFATKMNWWKKDMVPANVLNRNSAVDFTRKLSPIGGGAETFRVRARLKSNAVLKEAMTNTYGALMAALGVPEDEDPSGSKADRDFNEKVDTIYFLTDGNPTTGKLTMESEILDAVRRVNELRKVRIHAIAIGDFKKTFLKELAEQNGGVYVDMGG